MICPCCKINEVTMKDYRDFHGQISSYPSCAVCMTYDNALWRELRNSDDPINVLQKTYQVWNGRRTSWIHHVVWPEEEKEVMAMVKKAYQDLYNGMKPSVH